MTTRELWVVDLGVRDYGEALDLQRTLARQRITREIPEDLLLLVEHRPVVTMGRSTKAEHVLASREVLSAGGVEVFDVERGGDVTFHGPGQLVGYPIIDLKRHRRDLHWYLRQIEETLIRTLAAVGVHGSRKAGLTGVWVGVGAAPSPAGRKIASIGVHARDWVTWHGFALNVTTDLSYFDLIVPCGIPAVTMTSLARETGDAAMTVAGAADQVMRAFGEVFELEANWRPELIPSVGVAG